MYRRLEWRPYIYQWAYVQWQSCFNPAGRRLHLRVTGMGQSADDGCGIEWQQVIEETSAGCAASSELRQGLLIRRKHLTGARSRGVGEVGIFL